MPKQEPKNIFQAFDGMKSDYAAMTPSRFRRNRVGIQPLGSGADYHYRNELQFLRMREFVRAMDRDDAIIGSAVDKAVQQHVQNGFRLDPDTGDKGLDDDLWARWDAFATDPDECDIAGEMEFADMEQLALRHELIDGDIFALPTVDGPIQMIEADQCRTPTNSKRNIVLGIELDQRRRRQTYFFTRRAIDPFAPLERVGDTEQVAARDEDGERQVFHIFHPKRVSQTRGVTAFHPVFDIAGMWEDANFALLVKQQIAACFGAFIERSESYGSEVRTGERTESPLGDGNTSTIEGISPGMLIRGRKGEKLTAFSPNIPSSETMQHLRMLLQIIGVNIGMPLVLILLDASDTNFSGWRGAMDMARLGFRSNQRHLIRRFHKPVYRWKVRQWMAQDPALRVAFKKLGTRLFRHRWHTPTWPYVQPLDDARADGERIGNHLASPRQVAAERGREFDDVISEIVEDRVLSISKAIEASNVIRDKYGIKVDWREILHAGGDKTNADPGPTTAPAPADETGNPPDPDAPNPPTDGGSKD